MPRRMTSSTIGGDVLGGAKDIDEVDTGAGLLAGGGLGGVEVGRTREAEDLGESGVNGQDAVAVFDEVAADVIAGAPGLVTHAEDGDVLRGAEHLVDDGGIVGHGVPV